MTDPDARCYQRPIITGLCGHPYREHGQLLPGSNCGVWGCGCWAFKGAPLLARLNRWVRGLR